MTETTKYKRSPSLIDDTHLRAIGAVIVNWSAIEAQMELAICRLYEIPPNRGLVLTSNIGFQSRLALLRILAKRGGIKKEELADECLKLLVRIEKAYPKRNEVAHALWRKTTTAAGAGVMLVRAKGDRLRTVSEDRPIEDIEEVALELFNLGADFSELMGKLGLRPKK